MGKDTPVIIGIILIVCMIASVFTGCLEQDSDSDEAPAIINQDQPCILPNWNDGDYHDYYVTTQTLNDFNHKYPDLVSIFSVGKSVLGKDIWCIRITNEMNNSEKDSCLIDGCIHGVEWEAGEACLYLAEYLLINFETNDTIINILNTTDIFIIPLVNPDGRQNDEVGNDNGVDLNRNFDIFFGRLRSRVYRLGKLFEKIKIPYIKVPSVHPGYGWFRNSGRYAFSEPESQALRDFMISLSYHDFSFYMNCHTAWHNIMTPVPWAQSILNPPFTITSQEKIVFDYVKKWVEAHTEYEADKSQENKVGGATMEWCFNEFRIPSFTYEILSIDYDAWSGEQKHDHLVHWMKTTLPVFMYLLVNTENLRNWRIPNNEPLLPEGVPPSPLQ